MSAFITRTAGDVVAEILMIRTAFMGALLVIEGDDDVKFWRVRIAANDCNLVVAGSKPTVILAVAQAIGHSVLGVLGVVDDDFDAPRGIQSASQHIIRTETNDIETLMLSSSAFERVLAELGDSSKVITLEQNEDKDVRESLIDRARVFGQLRLLSALRGWGVDFKSLSPYRFSDENSWSVDHQSLYEEFCRLVPGLNRDTLLNELGLLPDAPVWNILHGKDTLCTLAVGLKRVIGGTHYTADRIAQALRLAYDAEEFRRSGLVASIAAWELANPPHRVI